MLDKFDTWYNKNEIRFAHGQFTDKDIARSAWEFVWKFWEIPLSDLVWFRILIDEEINKFSGKKTDSEIKKYERVKQHLNNLIKVQQDFPTEEYLQLEKKMKRKWSTFYHFGSTPANARPNNQLRISNERRTEIFMILEELDMSVENKILSVSLLDHIVNKIVYEKNYDNLDISTIIYDLIDLSTKNEEFLDKSPIDSPVILAKEYFETVIKPQLE
jgi:hypothetical protein